MWCVLSGDEEVGALGELNSSVDLLYVQCANSYKRTDLSVNLFFLSLPIVRFLLFSP